MRITLKPEQEACLNALVAAGDFTSVEEAAHQLIDDRMAELAAGKEDEMAWALPLVDEARADIVRREVIGLEEHRARNVRRLAALQP